MNAMLSSSRFHDVCCQLYRSALQPDPLADWARSISDLLDTDMVSFSVMAACGTVVKTGGIGYDDAAGREYLERYQYMDPLREFWAQATPGQALRIDDLPVSDTSNSAEFRSRYGRYVTGNSGICMLLEVRSTRVLVHAAHSRSSLAGENEMELLNSLRDDLLLSFEIAGSFMHASNLMEGVIRGLDQKGIGIAIVSEDGSIENINSSMDELLHAGSVLRMEQGRLKPGSSMTLSEFPGLMRRTQEKGACGRLVYQDNSGKRRASVIAYPAPVTFDWEGVSESKVVLLVTNSERARSKLAQHLRTTYGLTQAEARVGCLLLDGKTSRHIATELGVQINSVRAHLKAVYGKTETHSQVELLNLLQAEQEQGS